MRMDDYFDDGKGRHILDTDWSTADRPKIAAFFQSEELKHGSNAHAAALNTAKADYVIQRATIVGNTLGSQLPPQPRFSRLEVAKCWMLGFLEWYCVAPQALRDDTDNHRLMADDCDAGSLIMARRTYRNIDWSLDYIKRVDGIWKSAAISADSLDRIEAYWDRAQVETWQSVRVGYIWFSMPHKVNYAGKTITLGFEIVHDWISPPDINHGVGMLTISHMLGEIKKVASVGSTLQTSVRANTDGYRFSSGNKSHIIAIGKQTGDVVTCYRV